MDISTQISTGASANSQSPNPPLRFPGEDGGRSFNEMAERDLVAALQLLAERAQYITGATGAAIALLEDGNMVCRASAGSSAPELGAHLQVSAGLSGESVRTRNTLRCDDAATDTRVNRESCRALGIFSVVVMPIIHDQEVHGVFELLSDRPHAFEDRDITALKRLGEMIQTAIEHVNASRRLHKEMVACQGGAEERIQNTLPGEETQKESNEEDEDAVLSIDHIYRAAPLPIVLPSRPEADVLPAEAETQVLSGEPSAIRKCAACGFPVSGGRLLCVDCEKAQPFGAAQVPTGAAPEFLSQFADANAGQGWLRSHLYLIAALLVIAATVLLLLWRRS